MNTESNQLAVGSWQLAVKTNASTANRQLLTANYFSSVPLCLYVCAILLFSIPPLVARGQGEVSSSALIGEALDGQLSDLSVRGGLSDVLKAVEDRTGVRVEAVQGVWDALPWGQDTTLTVHVRNTTVRRALDLIARRLGLTYTLGSEAVVLEPTPALARLGRRATLEEVQVLDRLAATPADLSTEDATVGQVLKTVDARLRDRQSPFAVQDRFFDSQSQGKIIHVARNASLMEALEEISHQTDATWYPWGHSLVVADKIEATRLLLTKRLTRRYRDVDLQQVLAELAEYSDVLFSYAPGALQQVPVKYSKVTLTLDDATVEQTLEILSGATGLKFTSTTRGVEVTYDPGGKVVR
jgi:hypothetical protein